MTNPTDTLAALKTTWDDAETAYKADNSYQNYLAVNAAEDAYHEAEARAGDGQSIDPLERSLSAAIEHFTKARGQTPDTGDTDQFAQQVADHLYAREHADEINARAGDQQLEGVMHKVATHHRAGDDTLAEVLTRVAAEGHVDSRGVQTVDGLQRPDGTYLR